MKKIIFLLCLPFLCFSQDEFEIFGTVLASDTDEPLAYADVYISSEEGIVSHSFTDSIGSFKLNYKGFQNLELTVSYLGYKTSKTQLNSISPKAVNRNIILDQDLYLLEEVTIVGLKCSRACCCIYTSCIYTDDGFYPDLHFEKRIKDFHMDRDPHIKIFPNPAIEQTTIRSKSGIKSINIYNTNGSILISENFPQALNEYELNTLSYLPGHYYVNLTDKQSKSFTKKLIVVRP